MKTFTLDRRTQWLLPALSGLFIGTSYIPFPPWASLFCFVPLWLFWRRQTTIKAVFLGGLMASFVFTLIGFNWMTYLLHEFAQLDWPLALLGMAAFALVAHLFVPLAGVLWFLGQSRFRWPEGLSLTMMALITTLCEAYSLTLFDWTFGYSWYGAGLPVYHWAEFIGFSGLSAATLMSNLAFLHIWNNRHNRSGKVVLAAGVSAFVLLNLGGIWLKNRLPAPDASVRALLVQGNIGNVEKLEAEFGDAFREEILRRYFALTDYAASAGNGKIDLVLWPETAFPTLLGEEFKNKAYPTVLREYLKDRQLALVTGAFGVDRPSRLPTNSIFVLDRNGEIIPPSYSKTILLAFGEYIPGEQLFPQIREWFPQIGQFARGAGPTTLLSLNQFRMGPQVCYESLFPDFTRALADLGAQFIVNVTNDSWYGHWQEPYQHMFMTLARSVEFRRPVLRVTNTGISTVALASGAILQQSTINQEWARIYDVPYRKEPAATFYQSYYWLVPALLWSALVVYTVHGVRLRAKLD